ncbi:hypothetical protein [Pseudomonas sp. GM80]|uniref:hypothetical protein n=1 Tax=Pseudomonas sp. GM80 TaxID=1144339 RepID=UPI00026FD0DB|nr:hypothetical protein [Pseudomonas sp. GM80]EJN34367.1 hypothetical protein PMI37_01227 [Pseudomonas sp. GM80]
MGSKKRLNKTNAPPGHKPDFAGNSRTSDDASTRPALSLATLLSETVLPEIDREWENLTPVGREFR